MTPNNTPQEENFTHHEDTAGLSDTEAMVESWTDPVHTSFWHSVLNVATPVPEIVSIVGHEVKAVASAIGSAVWVGLSGEH